ncbi:TonB-dependent receptor domain-containing protein [Chromobacterium sp. IIBBL 290-4]|uniref:TonB-dependent receptor domain-containing protein n=1 Tax=Chromobacterium sp. IIBBL 290-4 TaxID=2953890 RepID=UPI0020B76773|nr:TonB-dependent receptor [Chromobacterium sp. IIBBL 290-4]UTH73688.1 TonB-dependent receptor [Chromobacterium sp. IIBBL 290-4]
MKKKTLATWLAMPALCPQALWAAPQEQMMEPVRVTATSPERQKTVLEADDLRRARGTGNADIFSGQPSVTVNNARNEAGAIDLAIRGLQGEGRVPVVIDGSLQSTHTNRGYQGTSDRTYIDTDLISRVSIEEGASTGAFSSGAVGGLVQMKTLGVEDVLLPGESFGALVKGNLYNNNKMPDVPANERDQVYYQLNNGIGPRVFNNGSATLALAYKQPGYDALIAFSKRRTGNYFAGQRGRDLYPEAVTSPGQEVVNTSYDSNSLLAKLGLNVADGQRAQFIYRRHQQRAGELLAAYWYKGSHDRDFNDLPPGVETMPQWELGTADVHAYSASYSYAPSGNRLIDLQMAAWATQADMRQHNGLWSGPPGSSYGDQYLHAYRNDRHGVNLSNRSELSSLPLMLEYGLAVQQEKIRPTYNFSGDPSRAGSARRGLRQERSLFANANLDLGRAQLMLGANLHDANTRDYAAGSEVGFSPRADLLAQLNVKLADWADAYLKTSRSSRMPSLYESTTSTEIFNYNSYNPLRPEQSVNRELGLRAQFADVLSARDSLKLRASYFDNTVHDFITGAWLDSTPGMSEWRGNFTFLNYDKLRLRGYELGLNYKSASFFVDAAATLYRQPEVCSALQAGRRDTAQCNANGFAWSLIPTRIPPKNNYVVTAGKYLLDGSATLGGRMRYHSAKTNPAQWLQGTGASPVIELPSEKLFDLFAEYKMNKRVSLSLNVDNLTNRYAVDPGSVISMPMPGRTIRLGMEAKL